jgi:hypothetical protein
MSNKTQLQTNNASLDECIARINAAKDVAAGLPEAGGSGGNVETCFINVNSDYVTFCTFFYQQDATHYTIGTLPGQANFTAVCDSLIYISQNGYYKAHISAGEILTEASGLGCIYKVPNTPGASISINIETD